MMKRTYINLKEALYDIVGLEYDKLMDIDEYTDNTYKFSKIVEDVLDVELPEQSILTDTKLDALWKLYIYSRYKDECITYYDGVIEDTDKIELVREWLIKYVNVAKRTFDEYSRLIDQVDNVDLFNAISTYSESRFNDTPQTNSDGIIDTQYATTYTVNHSSVDTDNAAKIAEVEQLIKDYYQKWSDEFKELFIYD